MSNPKFDDLLNILGKAISDSSYDKVDIGSISDELRKRFIKMGKDKEILGQEMKTRKEILESELELKLFKEFNERIDGYDELKTELWEAAEKELGLPSDGNYSMNFKTGVVSKKVQKKNPENIFQTMAEKKRW